MSINLGSMAKGYPTLDPPEFVEGGFTTLEGSIEHHYSYTEGVGDIRIDVSTSDGEFMKWYLSESRHANQK